MRKSNKFISLSLVLLLMITMIGPTVSMAAETTVDLGTADSFAILASSTITNTGTTTIEGDVGLHPGTEFSGQETATINGELHLTDAVAEQAKIDLTAAFNDAAGRTINTVSSELGGSTLVPGVYSSATSFQITGTLTLDGQNNSDSVFIFQTGSTLTTASSSNIELINGANYNNIFWQVGSSATLGSNSEFAGTILSAESITVTTGANIQGKLLALGGAITLDNNTITNPVTSSLTVMKVVTGDVAGLTMPAFEITVLGPENFSETLNLVHNESFTWDNLALGTYTVTENRTGLSGEWTVSGEGEVQVLADQENLVTVINAYNEAIEPEPEPEPEPEESTPVETTPIETTPIETTPIDASPIVQLNGSLTVEKVVTGEITDMTLPRFEITVSGPGDFNVTRTIANNTSYTWVNLVPGVYNVTENRTGLSSEWTANGEGEVEVLSEQTIVATITNHFEAIETLPTIPPAAGVPAVPEEPTVPEIPQTGQTTDYSMAMILGLAALSIAVLGVFSAKQRKRFNA